MRLKYLYKSMRGSLNNNWRGGISRKKGICLRCNKSFETTAYTKGIYCSRLCQNKYQAQKLHIEATERNRYKTKPKRMLRDWRCKGCGIEVKRKRIFCDNKECRFWFYRIKKNCFICNKTFITFKSKENRFCSLLCRDVYYKGKGNPHYIDGSTPEYHAIRNSNRYYIWRIAVFTRDNYTCQSCGQIGGELHADHIKQFAFYPELRLELSNGRTLCKPCHTKTDTYMKGRKKVFTPEDVNALATKYRGQ